MAPLVLGGAVRPGHAIGARVALALGRREGRSLDAELEARVQAARVRRARRGPRRARAPTPAEWTLAAALHDLLQAANPAFDAALRRSAAARILELARETIERVPAPPTCARRSRVTRGSRACSTSPAPTPPSRGGPARRPSWASTRRGACSVAGPAPRERGATPHALLELAPLAVERSRLTDAVARLLTRTPLTELATCTREAPAVRLGRGGAGAGRDADGQDAGAARARAPAPGGRRRRARPRDARAPGTRRRGAPAVTLLAERPWRR